MILLETARLCVLVFACLPYCIKKKVFRHIYYYGKFYNTGNSLCLCISSILPSSYQPYYNYRPSSCHQPQRNNWNTSWSDRPLDRRSPTINIWQYIQGLVGGTNNTEQKRSIGVLYLGQAENGSSHIVFKLGTKVVVSVNKVVVIPTLKTVIYWVNEMGISEKEPEGVQFTNRDGRVIINNLDISPALLGRQTQF